MNLKELEYIVKIAEERNVTHAAEKLFLTPSALNQQLLNLEKELGAPLFQRIRGGWIPTEVGEVYLETAREMLRMKRETYHRLQDMIAARKGTLSVGIPPERGAAMFTAVYPQFHAAWPEITVKIHEVNVHRQQQMIARGDIDIGFLTLKASQRTSDEYIPICQEEILLAVPQGHPLCREAVSSSQSAYPVLDLFRLRYEPFALMDRESTLRQLVDETFRQSGFVPTVLFETARSHTILSMVSSRLCCGLVPGSCASDSTPGVAMFSLPAHPTWELTASYKKGSYLSKPARLFIQLASQYWQNA